MHATPLPQALRDAAPELIRRLGFTLVGLAALVARRFLRNPRFFALIVPLYGRLQRAVRRFERAVTRPVALRKKRAGGKTVAHAPVMRLPAGKGWLVRELGWEAVGYGSQLQHLLDDPAMRVALASVPAVGRILRPICRMLGVTMPDLTLAPVGRVQRVRAKVPRPAPTVERRHAQVSLWMHRPAKTPA